MTRSAPATTSDALALLVAVLACLVALAVWVATGRAAESPPAAATPAAPAGANPRVDLARVRFPLACGQVGTVADRSVAADLTGDGLAEVVVAVRCDAGAGSPPHTVLLYAPTSDPAAPRLLATLVPAAADVLVERLSTTGDQVTVRGRTYSSSDLPRCCPDTAFERRWRYDGTQVTPVG